MPVVEVPWQRISSHALQSLIEEFINREGTDYGLVELSLEEKVERLRKQVEAGEVLIIFDEETESCQLVLQEDRPLYS